MVRHVRVSVRQGVVREHRRDAPPPPSGCGGSLWRASRRISSGWPRSDPRLPRGNVGPNRTGAGGDRAVRGADEAVRAHHRGRSGRAAAPAAAHRAPQRQGGEGAGASRRRAAGRARGERPFDALGEKGEGREGRRRGQTRSDQRQKGLAPGLAARSRGEAQGGVFAIRAAQVRVQSRQGVADGGRRTNAAAVRPSSGRADARDVLREAARHAEAPAAAAGCGRACARDRARVREPAPPPSEAHRLHNPQAAVKREAARGT